MSDEADPYRSPTEEDIRVAEERLRFTFPPDYREFLKGGGSVAVVRFRPAIVLPGSEDRDIFDFADVFWRRMRGPRHLLPIIENDGDFFCISPEGEVFSWSSDRKEATSRWKSLADWNEKVCSSGL